METDPLILNAMLAIFADQGDAAEAGKLRAEIASRMH